MLAGSSSLLNKSCPLFLACCPTNKHHTFLHNNQVSQLEQADPSCHFSNTVLGECLWKVTQEYTKLINISINRELL